MKDYTDSELAAIQEKLAIARISAIKTAPYYRRGLLALVPVLTPGLGTFATDKSWRMYYDPEMVEAWTIPEIAAVWLHELGHQLRDHAERFRNTGDSSQYAPQWNIAADAGINTDLKEMGVLLPSPDQRYYSDSTDFYPRWKKSMSTEELYEISRVSMGDDNSQDGSQRDQDDSEGSEGDQEPTEPSTGDSEPSEGDSEDTDDQDGDSGDSQDSEGGSDSDAGSEEESGSGEGSPGDSDSSSNSQSDENEGDEKEGSAGSGGGAGSEEESPDSSDSSGAEGEGNGQPPPPSCGSAADNIPKPYEKEDTDDGSLTETQAEKLKKEVSRDIIAYNKSTGTVPGGILKEAEDGLRPQANWKAELRKLSRKLASFWAGQQDFSMSRVSRRSPPDLIMPGSVDAEPPVIVVVLDTSGSMSPADLGMAIAEVKSILKKFPARGRVGLRIIVCDAASHEAVEVVKAENLDLMGGGGTDMRVGIAAAAELKPTPDLIVTITDGYTPWPQEPDKNAPRARYIALITVNKNLTPEEKEDFRVPDFIAPIFANTKLKLK